MKILVVDDQKEVIEPFVEILTKMGKHEVVTAEDGNSALALLKVNKHFDMIITDMEMPVLNGLGLLLHTQGMSITKWLVSGVMDGKLAEEAKSLGASRAFDKMNLFSALREEGLV